MLNTLPKVCDKISHILTRLRYFFLLDAGRCDNALAAAVFDVGLVRPSRNTLEAAFAADADVTFAGAFA